jgi:hypothetical protein
MQLKMAFRKDQGIVESAVSIDWSIAFVPRLDVGGKVHP